MLGDSDGSKDSSLESNEFRNYGRGDGMFKEVNKPLTTFSDQQLNPQLNKHAPTSTFSPITLPPNSI